MSLLYALLPPLLLLALLYRLLRVPPHLAHLPCVPLLPLLLSYASGETEDRRIRRVFLPFAEKHGHGLVLVWTLGTWMVHCLDWRVGKAAMENRELKKQPPPEHMLFWRFTGHNNIFFVEGERWRRQASIIRPALVGAAPIREFIALSGELLAMLGAGGRVCWSDLAHRFSLDALGTTVLGYSFHALRDPDSAFVAQYHRVMASIANPAYIVLPFLESWLPRKRVMKDVDELVERFCDVLAEKKEAPGKDLLSRMLRDGNMDPQEWRDNVVVLFMAGHDTTAGALSSAVYFLALYPDIQARARAEAISALGAAEIPDAECFSAERLPYLSAVIRECMRVNNPSTTNIPRVAEGAVALAMEVDEANDAVEEGGVKRRRTSKREYVIPPGTPVMLDMYGVHHNGAHWADVDAFKPERFLRTDTSASPSTAPVTDTSTDAEADHRAWLPFGLGPRQCPARIFALAEQRVLLALLLRQYSWSLPAESRHKLSERERSKAEAEVYGLRNGFSAFALNLPVGLEVDFVTVGR